MRGWSGILGITLICQPSIPTKPLRLVEQSDIIGYHVLTVGTKIIGGNWKCPEKTSKKKKTALPDARKNS